MWNYEIIYITNITAKKSLPKKLKRVDKSIRNGFGEEEQAPSIYCPTCQSDMKKIQIIEKKLMIFQE